MAIASDFRSLEHRLVAPVHDAIERVRAEMARRSVYRRTLKELDGLTDAQLDDIGVTHAAIRRLAREEAAKI